MLRFPAVNANKLRVRIDECRLTAYVSQVAAYYAEPLQEETTKEDWNNLPRSGWKQVAASPLTIDLGKTVTLSSFTYAPSKAEAKPTMAFRYQFFVSMDGKSWKCLPVESSAILCIIRCHRRLLSVRKYRHVSLNWRPLHLMLPLLK